MRRYIISLICLFFWTSATSALEIIWVSDAHTPAANFAAGANVAPEFQTSETPWDQGWIDLLIEQGHHVDYQRSIPGDGYWRTLDETKLDLLDAADLVIISSDTDGAFYAEPDSLGGLEEETVWNSVETPVILMNSSLAVESLWNWLEFEDLAEEVPVPLMDLWQVGDVATIDVLDETVGAGRASFVLTDESGNGQVLATVDASYPDSATGGIDGLAGAVWVVQWAETSVGFYDGSRESPAGVRLLLTAGTVGGNGADDFYWGPGMYNLTPEGEALFLEVVNTIPEPATVFLLGLGGLALLRKHKVTQNVISHASS